MSNPKFTQYFRSTVNVDGDSQVLAENVPEATILAHRISKKMAFYCPYGDGKTYLYKVWGDFEISWEGVLIPVDETSKYGKPFWDYKISSDFIKSLQDDKNGQIQVKRQLELEISDIDVKLLGIDTMLDKQKEKRDAAKAELDALGA